MGETNGTIGKVTATQNKPSTCTTVSFWLQPGVLIRPFDIVRISHLSAKGGHSHSFAIVKEMSYITDSAGHLASYVSSDFGEVGVQPLNQRLGATIAEAEILGNTENVEMPIRDGELVEWADAEQIRQALGMSRLVNPVPAGYIRTSNGSEVSVDFESQYLVGPEAAHLNISGISGLASKTSYGMFLMSALQQKMGEKVSIILFNVKGADLLAIDQPNDKLGDPEKEEWKRVGLDPIPLSNVRYLYPYKKGSSAPWTSSSVPSHILQGQIERGVAHMYYYDVEAFTGTGDSGEDETAREKLSLLFSDIDDPQSTMESCIQAMGELEASTWGELRDEVADRAAKGGKASKGDIPIQSWRKFSRLVRTRTMHDVFDKPYMGPDSKDRCQKTVADALCGLKGGQVLVVDIQPLPDYLQCLVVGDVIRSVFNAKVGLNADINPDDLGTVVVFADELNKYAPSTGGKDRTLSRWLLEVTERGRSLGVVLFGAEQFRSGVHDRVLGNCGTNVYGRTNPIELQKCADYRHFAQNNKSAILHLSQGQVLLQHSVFNTHLIKVRFPHPAYLQLKGGALAPGTAAPKSGSED